MASIAATHEHDLHGHGHEDHDHHELGFWRKWVFSTDHKMIGIQYGVTGLVFLFFGFLLMLGMRWQLGHPGTPGAGRRPAFQSSSLGFGDSVFG